MAFWKYWIWPGIFTVVIVSALFVVFQAKPIQSDISAKAKKVLGSEFDWVDIETDGRDAIVSGTSPSGEATSAALSILREVPEIRHVYDQTELPEIADPYVFSVLWKDGKISLSGFYPSKRARENLLDEIHEVIPGSEIKNDLQTARGAPTEFTTIVETIIRMLPKLATAEVELSGNLLEIVGVAAGLEEYDLLLDELSDAFAGSVILEKQEIQPVTVSPYRWSVAQDDKGIRISGLAPNRDARDDIEKIFKKQLSSSSISNGMKIAAGAPREFKVFTDYAAGLLPNFSELRLQLNDSVLNISGVARSPDHFEDIEALLDKIPSGYALDDSSIEPPIISPHTWNAALSGEVLTLDGYAPSVDARRQLVVMAMNVFPDLSIVDNLRIAGGGSAEFLDAATLSLTTLGSLSEGKAVLFDEELELIGDAKTSDDYLELVTAIESFQSGVRISNLVKPPEVKPYRWTIGKTHRGITLRGNVPGIEDRKAVLAEVRELFPDLALHDKMELASGEPGKFAEARLILSDLLANLDAGQGTLLGTTISVVGRASEERIARQAEIDLAERAPDGFQTAANILWPRVTDSAILPPVATQYHWSINLLPKEVVILGHIDSEEARQEVLRIVKQELPVSNVSDMQEIARGKPVGFDEVRFELIRQLRLLDAGQAKIIGEKVLVNGRARNANIRRLIELGLKRSLPSGYELIVDIVVPVTKTKEAKPVAFVSGEAELMNAEDCQAAVQAAVADRKIQFESASAEFVSTAEPVLLAVLGAAKKCPNFELIVIGHTDSKGSDNFNQQLSQARAAAVVDFFAKMGVSKNRMKFKGMGASNPIASNDTEAGRTANRRIEFLITEQ